jgi:hypothetical protein
MCLTFFFLQLDKSEAGFITTLDYLKMLYKISTLFNLLLAKKLTAVSVGAQEVAIFWPLPRLRGHSREPDLPLRTLLNYRFHNPSSQCK